MSLGVSSWGTLPAQKGERSQGDGVGGGIVPGTGEGPTAKAFPGVMCKNVSVEEARRCGDSGFEPVWGGECSRRQWNWLVGVSLIAYRRLVES